ncbi:outer membrane protein assembly factor BamE domain-containing protein [Sphingomonas sp.]|uniref:outer membrane protein assembly factor BamE domain-containing protein n=1 Tax=Sphingomonas sp. TaxID=28214 RepID=UPI002D7F9681|nr:outer membrane protein assembly factor BamE [Sphingomonas sp.]HEU0043911.1 outer membrane protein assembly factor BamE [Sphingomonas sp.]
MTFDPQIWADQAAVYAPPYPRRQMVADIRRTHLKAGATRAEVIALLGAPTETDKFADHDLVYWLGPEEGAISVDSQWLLIDLDAAARVNTVAVATD